MERIFFGFFSIKNQVFLENLQISTAIISNSRNLYLKTKKLQYKKNTNSMRLI